MRKLTLVGAVLLSLCIASSVQAFGFGWSGDREWSWKDIQIDREWKWDGGGAGTDWDWDDLQIDRDKIREIVEGVKEEWDLKDWREECEWCTPDRPKSAIPEPTAAVLFAGGAAVFARRRRRNQR